MPVKVRAAKNGKGYEIYEVETGKVVGHSDTVGNAQASARHRNDAFSKKTKGN